MTELATIGRDEVSVVSMLEHAKQWLATAVETTGPAEIAAAKAQIVTAETYAKELRLSKDIQLDAAEMVRRAEYALGKAIRKGQEEGTIRTQADGGRQSQARLHGYTTESKPGPTDFAAPHELTGQSGQNNGIYALAEAETETFETALHAARTEGNLSRANVVRKVKSDTRPASHVSRESKADVIADLAAQGYSSRQMPERVGVSEETVRAIAREFDIEIPADKVIGRTRRLDHTQMVASAVTDLENQCEFLQSFIDLDQVDLSEADEWVSSLTNSLRVLNRFVKQIKEKTHV